MKRGLAKVACALLFGVTSLYVFQASVGPNIVRLPGQSALKPIANTLMPEGWAFFTKPADSSVITIYRASETSFREATSPPNAEPVWLFGLNRESRYQAFEAATLLVGIDQKNWLPCSETESSVECLGRVSASVEVRHRGNPRTLCGNYGLVAEGVVPWSYRDLSNDIRIPREAVMLEVSCV